MKYAPGLPPTDDARLREYIQKELLKISDTIDQIHLHEKSYKTPAKPQDGQVEFADGTNWNPDATNGEGLYRYDASSDTWRYLEATGGGGLTSPLTTTGDVWVYGTTNGDDRLPAGTDGYFLTADSTTDLGVKWAAGSSFSSPLTTKGDLYTYSTTDARLPVSSTDGQMLVADSGETTGLNWAYPGVIKWVAYSDTIVAGASNFTNTYKTVCSLTFSKLHSTSTVLVFGSMLTYSPASPTSGNYITLQLRDSGGTGAYVGRETHDVGSTYGDVSGFELITGLGTGSRTIEMRAQTSTTDIFVCNKVSLVAIEIKN